MCKSTFFISALAGGDLSDSRSGRFIPGERTAITHWIGCWSGLSNVVFMLTTSKQNSVLETLIVAQLLKKFLNVYENRNCIAIFIRTRNWSCILFVVNLAIRSRNFILD
jgi:hypothetical protein